MLKSYVYPFSHAAAEQDGNNELWQKSFADNVICAWEITGEISRGYGGASLDENAAKNVIDKFGYDRVNWVLAANIEMLRNDENISVDNKGWSNSFYMRAVASEITNYRINAKPELLELFINQARQEYDALGLFSCDHISDYGSQMNYEGKVLILNPLRLRNDRKCPENQLVLATGGQGCNPDARGRCICGMFLVDGEECLHDREDFLGALDDKHMPDWARERFREIQEAQTGSEQASGLTM